MNWVMCKECIILKEEGYCEESCRADGCYFGMTNEDIEEENKE
jgi:hypothetical protein